VSRVRPCALAQFMGWAGLGWAGLGWAGLGWAYAPGYRRACPRGTLGKAKPPAGVRGRGLISGPVGAYLKRWASSSGMGALHALAAQ